MSATTALDPAPTAAKAADDSSITSASGGDGSVLKPAASSAVVDSQTVEVAPVAAESPLEAVDAAQRHKALTVARIRLSKAPAGLKERFAELAETANNAAAVEACLKAVEESLPEFLRDSGVRAARPEHPSGEVFFRGSSEELTDAQAEEIAQRQLARSGLLRGQKVRVAD